MLAGPFVVRRALTPTTEGSTAARPVILLTLSSEAIHVFTLNYREVKGTGGYGMNLELAGTKDVTDVCSLHYENPATIVISSWGEDTESSPTKSRGSASLTPTSPSLPVSASRWSFEFASDSTARAFSDALGAVWTESFHVALPWS